MIVSMTMVKKSQHKKGDHVRDRFPDSQLTFVEDSTPDRSSSGVSIRMVMVECSCGSTTRLRALDWVHGKTQSCGCTRSGSVREVCETHGMTGTRQYYSWASMVQRSREGSSIQKAAPSYVGVQRDPKWDTFEGFWEDMGPTYFDGAVLSRVGDTGDYTMDNCVWVSRGKNARQARENSGRMRKTSWGTFVVDEARSHGILARTVLLRIQRGWFVDDACTIPPGGKRPTV